MQHVYHHFSIIHYTTGDREHKVEKKKDMKSGQIEENQEFVNLDESKMLFFHFSFRRKKVTHTPDLTPFCKLTNVKISADRDNLTLHHQRHIYVGTNFLGNIQSFVTLK